jgi:DNA polymerase-3 subunit delta
MARMAWHVSKGQAVEQVMGRSRVWDKRKPLVRQGLKRFGVGEWRSLLRDCAQVDAVLKGLDPGADPWEALLSLSTRMAGLHLTM